MPETDNRAGSAGKLGIPATAEARRRFYLSRHGHHEEDEDLLHDPSGANFAAELLLRPCSRKARDVIKYYEEREHFEHHVPASYERS